jgi:hypothetical protein
MTQRWYVRAALAVLVGMGATAGLTHAQQPAPAPAPGKEPWAVIEYGAGAPLSPDAAPTTEAPGAPRRPVLDWLHSRPRPIVDHVHDCMHAKGVGCWSHHNAYLCGSWKSECTFVFGSCRAFFGEPCLPGPPAPPAVPGGGPATGYGPAPQRRAGCPSCQ